MLKCGHEQTHTHTHTHKKQKHNQNSVYELLRNVKGEDEKIELELKNLEKKLQF